MLHKPLNEQNSSISQSFFAYHTVQIFLNFETKIQNGMDLLQRTHERFFDAVSYFGHINHEKKICDGILNYSAEIFEFCTYQIFSDGTY